METFSTLPGQSHDLLGASRLSYSRKDLVSCSMRVK